jgi:hypothetical protein
MDADAEGDSSIGQNAAFVVSPAFVQFVMKPLRFVARLLPPCRRRSTIAPPRFG